MSLAACEVTITIQVKEPLPHLIVSCFILTDNDNDTTSLLSTSRTFPSTGLEQRLDYQTPNITKTRSQCFPAIGAVAHYRISLY